MINAEKQTSPESRISKIEALPPFPLLSNIIKAFVTAESDGEIRPLLDNIGTEPNILAKIIGVANSAAFGTHFPVRSLKDAVMKLGIIQLKSLVFSIIMTSRFDRKACPSFHTARFWQDSMLLAHCAGLLVEYCEAVPYSRNEVHSIAMVLRIGLMALINIAPKEMDTVLTANDREELLSRERMVFDGFDHYSAGSVLLYHWNLPDEYYEIVKYMEDVSYTGKYHKTVLMLRRAKELINTDFSSDQPEVDRQLGLTTENIDALETSFNNNKSWIDSFAKHL